MNFKTGILKMFSKSVQQQGHIIGSDVIMAIEVPHKPFRKLKACGGVKVNFTLADTPLIKISGPDNLLKYLILNFMDDTLHIKYKDGASFATKLPLYVNIQYPDLDIAELCGSGEILVSGVNTPLFEAVLNGPGIIKISGQAEQATLTLTGSGDIRAFGLKASNLIANLSGSGEISAAAHISSNAKLSGSGEINIYGRPTVRMQKLSGSGEIIYK